MSDNSDLPLVIALVAQNENETLFGASNSLGQSLPKHYRYRVVNLFSPYGSRELLTLLKTEKVAFAYGFAGVGSQLSIDNGINLWTAARVPFVALWYDHPCYNYKQHITDSPYVLNVYHVRDHYFARKKYLPRTTSSYTLISPPFETRHYGWPHSMGQRPHTIVYAKTAISPMQWKLDWQNHPKPLQEALNNLAEMAIKDRNIYLVDAAKKIFDDTGLPSDNLDFFMGVVQEVDAYVRAWRSDKLARALLAFPTQIIGRGWEYLHDQPHKATFIPAMTPDKYWEMCWHSKIVANSSPLVRDSIHERVWGGLLTGALVLSDHTRKSSILLGQASSFCGFEWEDDLQDVISATLARASQDEDDYLVSANKNLIECGLTALLEYPLLIEQEVFDLQQRLAA